MQILRLQVTDGMRTGAVAVAPMALAVGVLGFVFGCAARVAGFSPAAAIVMSAVTFAGSPQFAAIAVLSAGGTALAAAAAAALLAARFAIFGAIASPSLNGNVWRRFFFGQLIVDETWAVAYTREERFDADRLMGAGITLYAVHVASTAVGVWSASLIGSPASWGVEAAAPALFVVLLWPRLERRDARVAAAAAAGAALVTTPLLPPGAPILVAVSAAFASVLLR
jgi:4-azaleucine resistance transporter AzlC